MAAKPTRYRPGAGRLFTIPLSVIVVSLCSPGTVTAQTEIHKCTDADGGVVYSQLPCVDEERVETEKPEPDEVAETTEQETTKRVRPDFDNSQDQPQSNASRAACKKRYRDAIDAIDVEIGRDYSAEKGEQYKQRLLALTRDLRQC